MRALVRNAIEHHLPRQRLDDLLAQEEREREGLRAWARTLRRR
jgi:hypothetical protein